MFYLILAVSAAMATSFVCSFAEAVLLSVTPTQIGIFSQKHPDAAVIWHGFKTRIDRPITVILLLNTAAYSVGATIAGAQVVGLLGDTWVVLFSLVFTYMMVQFSEILPKTLGVRFNRKAAPYIARPLEVITRLLTPLVKLVTWVNKPFAGRISREQQNVALEEMSAIAALARLTNLIGPYQEKIIKGAWGLSRTPVEDIMVPLEETSFLDTRQTIAEALVAAHMELHTRFPVCEDGDKNKVVGYVNFKEMVQWAKMNPADPSFRGIIRPVHFVNSDVPAATLLRDFIDKHVHIAIVQDGKGKTLGLITLEDILEEMVGELEDEFDRAPRMCQALSGGAWILGGGLAMSDVAARLELNLPEVKGSLSAWLIERMGRVPKANDIHHALGYQFLVRRVRRRKVFEVLATRVNETAQ